MPKRWLITKYSPSRPNKQLLTEEEALGSLRTRGPTRFWGVRRIRGPTKWSQGGPQQRWEAAALMFRRWFRQMDGRVKESGSFLFLSCHIFFRAAAPAISKSAKLCDFSCGKTNGARTWDKRRERSGDLSAGPVYCCCRQRHTPDILFQFEVLGPGPTCYRLKHFV